MLIMLIMLLLMMMMMAQNHFERSIVICYLLLLFSNDAFVKASWTIRHQSCSSSSLYFYEQVDRGAASSSPSSPSPPSSISSSSSSSSSSSQFDYRCENSNYMKYIQEELHSGSSTATSGYRREVFDAIVNMYSDLEVATKPAKLDNFDLHGSTLIMHPIGFSIPEEFIMATIPPKDKLLSRVIPGNKATYFALNEESAYRQDMSSSLFSWTHKKAGWDCMRHYEILASGTLPLFIDIDSRISKSSLLLHPRKLYSLILKYPGLTFFAEKIPDTMSYKFDKVGMNVDTFDKKLYMTISAALLQYTRNVFSTKSMAFYLLKTVRASQKIASISSMRYPTSRANGNNNVAAATNTQSRTALPKSVLYLTHAFEHEDYIDGDYLIDSLLHGLKTVLGSAAVTDFPRRNAIYKTHFEFNETAEYIPSKLKLYGGGFSYGHLLDDWTLNKTAETFNASLVRIANKIARKDFDLVILASGHMGVWPQKLYLWENVCKHYSRSQVVWIHGGDDPLFGGGGVGESRSASPPSIPSVDEFLETYFPCAGHYFSREGLHPFIWESFELLVNIKKRSATVEGKIFQEEGSKRIHVIEKWKARLIPDYDTFASIMNKSFVGGGGGIKEELWYGSVLKVPSFIFKNIPVGVEITSVNPKPKVIFHGKREPGHFKPGKSLDSKQVLEKSRSFKRPLRASIGG